MKRIKIDIDNIDKAIKELEELKQQIRDFPMHLAEEIGKPVAEAEYATIQDPNAHPLEVTAEQTENGALLKADGQDVVFYEYGAGIGTPKARMYDGSDDIPTGQGTWSQSEEGKGHIKAGDNDGFWFYNGMRYESIPPAYAMRHAKETIQEKAEKEAKEFFK